MPACLCACVPAWCARERILKKKKNALRVSPLSSFFFRFPKKEEERKHKEKIPRSHTRGPFVTHKTRFYARTRIERTNARDHLSPRSTGVVCRASCLFVCLLISYVVLDKTAILKKNITLKRLYFFLKSARTKKRTPRSLSSQVVVSSSEWEKLPVIQRRVPFSSLTD